MSLHLVVTAPLKLLITVPMKLVVIVSLLSLVSCKGDSQYWGQRGLGSSFSNPLSRSWGLQRYGSYGLPQPEPEPEPASLPMQGRKISRRLVSSSQQTRPGAQLVSQFTVKPFTFRTPTTTQQTTSTTTTTTTTMTTTTTTTQPTTRRQRRITTSSPVRRQNIQPLFDEASASLLDSVFAEAPPPPQNPDWRIHPGQFEVLAAVPGQPVQTIRSRLPKSAPKPGVSLKQFSPVPAVPRGTATTTVRPRETTGTSVEEVRQPKQNPRELEDLLGNSVEEEESVEREEQSRRETRQKFTRCHGRCVQQFCLPVEDQGEFELCGEKCNQLCI